MTDTLVLGVIDTTFGTCPACDSRMLQFEGGWGCSSCPVWIPRRRALEETVEKHPARPISLGEAVEKIRSAFVVETVEDPRGAGLLPAIVPTPEQQPIDPSIYHLPPTPMSEHIDLVTRITTVMLPVVREGIPLTDILKVAEQIARLR